MRKTNIFLANKYFKIRNVHPQNQNCTWTERMTDTLNSIKSNYCLFMLDDFFLYDYVKTKTVLDNLKVLKENPNNIELKKSICICLINLKAYDFVVKYFVSDLKRKI